ncbi:hypothetical protein BDY24DRAFT_224799 [Mrakia frigida]|uniref:uncharacterized protein n=1 Tax=Mrakia frigida TaxID=29902 RepID=UPI003FCC2664
MRALPSIHPPSRRRSFPSSLQAESSKDGAAAQVTPQITLSASFATLADALIVASQACRTFANVSGHDQDPAALAAVIAGIKASGISLGGLGATPGRKGPAPKTAEQEARADKKRKRAEKKAAKDPNAPKRPASAYLMYQNEVREHYKDLHPKVAYQEVLKLIGDSWKTLAEDQKKVYLDRASDSMDEYKKEAEGYKQDPTAVRPFSSSRPPLPPPFPYLSSHFSPTFSSSPFHLSFLVSFWFPSHLHPQLTASLSSLVFAPSFSSGRNPSRHGRHQRRRRG